MTDPAGRLPVEPPATIAVIGLGLMGGSIARDLAGTATLLAHDRDPGVLASAIDAGIVTGELGADLAGVAAADLVVLAIPVDRSLDALALLAPHLRPDAVVTDVGSTKAAITRLAGELRLGARFVGSHPLTGDHRSGWRSSRAGLYRGAPIFICPTPDTAPESVQRVTAFWELLGGACTIEDPAKHDRRMAWVSHLPQLVASATAAAIGRGGFSATDLGPGGRDVTRLAGSSPEMWTAICLANREPLQAAIVELEGRVAELRRALDDRDQTAVFGFFEEAREWLG